MHIIYCASNSSSELIEHCFKYNIDKKRSIKVLFITKTKYFPVSCYLRIVNLYTVPKHLHVGNLSIWIIIQKCEYLNNCSKV